MEIKDLYYTRIDDRITADIFQVFDWHIEDNQSKQW